MSEAAADVLRIKMTMDAEVEQYSRMSLPEAFRNVLIERTVVCRMEQAQQLLVRVLKHYDAAQNQRQV